MNGATLFWGLLFSSLGLGYLIYGRRQRLPVPFLCGLALMLVPYVVDDWRWLVPVGVVLAGLPKAVRL